MSKATSNADAFKRVRERLQADVGGIMQGIGVSNAHIPYWALVRMLFPVAEATADLIHGATGGTAAALMSLLQTELEQQRPGYKKIAATLTLLFRHSLTHTDEMRVLKSGGREIVWRLEYGNKDHLQVLPDSHGNFTVVFDCVTFYADLVGVLKAAEASTLHTHAMARYNSWLELDLDAKQPKSKSSKMGTRKVASREIAAL